jgi:hypothetical protein
MAILTNITEMCNRLRLVIDYHFYQRNGNRNRAYLQNRNRNRNSNPL